MEKVYYKFRRRHSVGYFILDFYRPTRRLAIEVDGESHFADEAIACDNERREGPMGTKFCTLLLIVVALTGATRLHAEIYRYTDKQGRLFYVDDISKVPQQYRQQLEDAEPLPEVSVMDATKPSGIHPVYEEKRKVANASVELFVTSWCGYCRKLEQFLDAKGVSYTRYDIEKDADASQRYQQLGVRGVPVTRVDAAVIIGYDPAAIISALGK